MTRSNIHSKLSFGLLLATLFCAAICGVNAQQQTNQARNNYLFSLPDGSLSAETRSTAFSATQRAQIFDDVWETIRSKYYDPNLRGVNWERQRATFRAAAIDAQTTIAFYAVLRQMINALHDSHTRIYAPNEKVDWRSPRVVTAGLSIREIENKLVAVRVDEDGDAARAGIREGAILISVDNKTADQIFAARLAAPNGSSTAAAARLRAASGILEGAENTFVRVEFRNPNGKQIIAALKREARTLAPTVSARRTGGALLISFDTFTPEIVPELFQKISANRRRVSGIILDLRGNHGGSAEAMIDVASAFLPADYLLGNFIDRAGRTVVEARARKQTLFAANALQAQNVPIVVLTSTATASAAEIFVAALKNQNRVKIIGQTTCGCVLAVKNQHSLIDGGALDISELNFQMPDGKQLEGAGVAPTETITQTEQDITAGLDRALERALDVLK